MKNKMVLGRIVLASRLMEHATGDEQYRLLRFSVMKMVTMIAIMSYGIQILSTMLLLMAVLMMVMGS